MNGIAPIVELIMTSYGHIHSGEWSEEYNDPIHHGCARKESFRRSFRGFFNTKAVQFSPVLAARIILIYAESNRGKYYGEFNGESLHSLLLFHHVHDVCTCVYVRWHCTVHVHT